VVGLGLQWLSGTGPRQQTFHAGDPALETLSNHWFIQQSIQGYLDKGYNDSRSYNYSLSGLAALAYMRMIS